MVAAVGVAVAVLSALLIREPAREFPVANESDAATSAKDDAAVEGGAAGEESEERESFREALGIVFQSDTVKLVRAFSLSARECCMYLFQVQPGIFKF